MVILNWRTAQGVTVALSFRESVGQNDDFDGFACLEGQMFERQGSVLRQRCLNSVRLQLGSHRMLSLTGLALVQGVDGSGQSFF